MTVIISYIFLGLSLAAPIGPINAAQLDRGIKNGFMHAWFIGIGSMIGDIMYMLCVYFGLVQFIEIPIIKAFLFLFGFFVLLYTGIESVISSRNISTNNLRKSDSLWKTFSSGFFMSISNPLSILFWIGIYGSILANTIHKVDTTHLIIYSSAIFVGVFLWDISMAAMASSFRKFLNHKALSIISLCSGISLICFSLYFGKEAFVILF